MSSRWWKAPEAAFLDRRLQRLPASLFRLWFNLNCVASWSGGSLPDLADVAFLLRTSPASLARRLELLKAAGLVAIGEDGAIVLVGANDAIEHERPTPMTAAERTRRWREGRREREHGDAARDAAVTAVTAIEKIKTREETDSPREAQGVCEEEFERFVVAYPSRDDGNPTVPALAAWRKAVDQGADPESMIAAAKRYGTATAGREARFICSAARWLSEGRWKDAKAEATTAPAATAPGHWIAADSEAGRLWAAYWRATKGKSQPTDANGGWRFPTPLPPALEAAA